MKRGYSTSFRCTIEGPGLLWLPVVTLLLLSFMTWPAAAQDPPVQAAHTTPIEVTQTAEIQARLARLKGALSQAATPLPAGESRALVAIVMQVQGRCQWRANEADPWKKAAVNDTLHPGASIRTGLNSMLTLRCGLNATLLVDSNTRARLPQVLQDGDVLRTIVTVDRGRADIQVDRVGLTNDFSVLTPSGSLAVKGTGMGVQYDGFGGTSIVGARHNRMNAIEMRYVSRHGMTFLMSGGAVSTQSVPNPSIGAALETQPAPSLQAYEAANAEDYDSVADQAMSSTDTTSTTTRVVIAQEHQVQFNAAIHEIEQEVIAGLLLEQQALLLAALAEAEAAAAAGIIDEEIAEVIEDIIDDGGGTQPPATILEIDGYKSYFNAMNSTSDQGFLAAAMVLDLIDNTTMLGDYTMIPSSVSDGQTNYDRRQIPLALEPTLVSTFGTGTGARTDLPQGYGNLPSSGPLLAMYTELINYGLANQDWYHYDSGVAPLQSDLVQMVQIYENYLAANPQVFGGGQNTVVARTLFTNSLNATLYQTQSAPGFTPYGNALLNGYVPSSWSRGQ